MSNSPGAKREYHNSHTNAEEANSQQTDIAENTSDIADQFFSAINKDSRKYSPADHLQSHGNGRCYILVNFESDLARHGIAQDIQALEDFYSNTLHYKVLGGPTNPHPQYLRDVDYNGLKNLILRLNHFYDPVVLNENLGDEHDLIIIHFFSTGDRDNIALPHGVMRKKKDLVRIIDSNIHNLRETVPVLFYLHTVTGDRLTTTQRAPASPTGDVISSPNLYAIFSVAQALSGRRAQDSGSWIIQHLVRTMRDQYQNQNLFQIINCVNGEADGVRHPQFVTIQNGFRLFYFNHQ